MLLSVLARRMYSEIVDFLKQILHTVVYDTTVYNFGFVFENC